MINRQVFYLLAFSALLLSCTHHIKNDLIYAVGHDIKFHEAYYGKPKVVKKSKNGTTRNYVNDETGCIYELDVNNSNIVTSYRFISDEEICVLQLNWGGPA